MSIPQTIPELIRLMVVQEKYRTGEIMQIDVDTVRVRIGASGKYIIGVPLVGASISDVVVGDKVEIALTDNRPYAYRLKSL